MRRARSQAWAWPGTRSRKPLCRGMANQCVTDASVNLRPIVTAGIPPAPASAILNVFSGKQNPNYREPGQKRIYQQMRACHSTCAHRPSQLVAANPPYVACQKSASKCKTTHYVARCSALFLLEFMVERRRIELPTFALRTRRSPSFLTVQTIL